MESRATRLEPEALLAHAGWLRTLAASLVADSATADDLVQDTWLAALEHPPRADGPIEPWLARVLRNFALKRRRGESRRAVHESATVESVEAPSPDQTVEKLDLQRTVLDAVLAIDEPFRTTIVLRYFEGRSCAEIARMQRVPAGTVRWRLKRGLDTLRERLDERFRGSRAAWVGLLAPLAAREPAPGISSGAASTSTNTVLKGALVVNATQIALTAVALVAVAGIAWWSLDGAAGPALEPVAASAPGSTVDAAADGARSTTSALDAIAVTDRSDRASAVRAVQKDEPQPTAPAADSERNGAIDARFVDERGLPRSGVRFAVCEESALPKSVWPTRPPPAISGIDGRARLEVPIPKSRLRARAGDDGTLVSEWSFRFTASSSGCATVERTATVRIGEIVHLGDVVLGPGIRIHGRVVDERGSGLVGATVGVAGTEISEDEGRTRRHGSDAFLHAPTITSSDDGLFVLDGVAIGDWRLWGKADGTRYAWTAPITVTADRDMFGVELVLSPMLATDRIEGRVVDPLGNPVADASLFYIAHAGSRTTATGLGADDQGRFALVIAYDDSIYDFTATHVPQQFAQATVTDVRPGTLDLVVRLLEKQFLDVRVLDADGRAVEGVTFDVSSRGYSRGARAELSTDGRYRVEIPDDTIELEVSATGWRTERRGPLDPRTMARSLEIVLRRAPVVRGRVVADGRAIAGAHVEARQHYPDGSLTVAGFRCVMSSWDSGKATTDADGRYELVCDLDGAFWIRVDAKDWVPGELGPIDVARLGADVNFDVALTKGGAIEGHVLLPDARDAEGTIVAINHGDGLPRTSRAGPNGLFRFDGLSPGRWQVLPRESEIDPHSTRYSSTDDVVPIEWSCEVVAGSTTRYDLDLTPK